MAKKSMIAKSEREPKFSTRQHNRCTRCGRPRAYYRKFGLCRVCLRELAEQRRAARRDQGFLVGPNTRYVRVCHGSGGGAKGAYPNRTDRLITNQRRNLL